MQLVIKWTGQFSSPAVPDNKAFLPISAHHLIAAFVTAPLYGAINGSQLQSSRKGLSYQGHTCVATDEDQTDQGQFYNSLSLGLTKFVSALHTRYSDATACNSHAHKSCKLILVGLFAEFHNGLVDGIKKAIKCRPID